jgi:CxxC motif-containing protein
MRRTFICILCPNGCEIESEYEGREILAVRGCGCDRGREYVEREIACPMRTISSLVRVQGGAQPLTGVRLSEPIPKGRIFDVMAEIRKLTLNAPVRIGQVAIPDVLGLGSSVIVTKNVGREN